jgi:hypothetical protein
MVDDFLQQVGEAGRAEPRIILRPYYEYGLAPIEYVIDDILAEDSLCNVYSDPGEAKSLFWQDAGFCVAAGVDFHGHAVKQGTVVIFVGEGMRGVLLRLRALEIRYGISQVPLYVTPMSAMLSDQGAAAEMISILQGIPGPIQMVIFDTLSRNFGGGNENSTQDMGCAVHNLDSVRRETQGAAMVTIHHAGKIDKNVSRGSSVLRAAADTEYKFSKDGEGTIRVECTKQKDGEQPTPMAFKIGTVDIGMVDRHGRGVFPPVLHSVEYTAPKENMRMGTTQAAFLATIQTLMNGAEYIQEGKVREVLRASGQYSKQQISATLKRMADKGLIHRSNGNIRTTQESGALL